jgi:pilus assembly protein Flp/PilA
LDLAEPECRGNPKEENQMMKNMKQVLARLMAEDSGQDLIEYALVAALVGLGAVAAMGTLKNAVATTFHSLTSHH